MLTINKTINEGTAVFTLEGRLDTNTSPELEKELNGALEEIQDLTMDFAALDYISSAGLRVLLDVNDTIMDIFEMTGFTEILTIVPAEKKTAAEEE